MTTVQVPTARLANPPSATVPRSDGIQSGTSVMRYRADQHLRRALDFQHVRTQGRRYDCGAFVLWFVQRLPERAKPQPAQPAPGPDSAIPTGAAPKAVPAQPARLGVVASRASVGNAVARARAKRRLRELFRAHQSRIPAGTDLLLVARSSLNGLEYAALEQRFVDACRKLFPSTPPAASAPSRAN